MVRTLRCSLHGFVIGALCAMFLATSEPESVAIFGAALGGVFYGLFSLFLEDDHLKLLFQAGWWVVQLYFVIFLVRIILEK